MRGIYAVNLFLFVIILSVAAGRFGFDLPKDSVKKTTGAKVVNDYYEWVFDPVNFDWLNIDNELTLTGYNPPQALISLLENNIDKILEWG